jgi:geranylgeranyl reductase family protein
MVAIIGAGPAGSYSAYLLAKQGLQVDVFEEHKQIGNPIQCSGVITPAIENLLHIPKSIFVNKITKVRFFSPDGNSFETKIKPDYVFERSKLDQFIADLAKREGADFHNKRFLGFEKSNNKLKLKFNDGFFETDKLVGADGPYSQVAKSAGLFKDRKFITGIQARATIPAHDKETVDIFLGYGEFGWLIPEDEYTARIGVVGEKNEQDAFKKLMENCQGKFLQYQSGMIPLYNPKIQTQKDNVYLIGDAAGMVKASTHGGILYSMIAAKSLAEAIKDNKNYDSLWRKELGFNLYLNLKIRNTLKKFSEKDYNDLVRYFSNEKLKELLATNVRDFPSKFLFKMLLAEPRLLKFGFKTF